MVTKGRHNFPSSLSSLSYHKWNLSLIARETMRLLVHHQLNSNPDTVSKHLSWTNLLRKISTYCRNFTVFSSFFDVKKQRPTMNFEKCYQCSVSIEIFLVLNVYFSLVTFKISNLIALRSTNQVIEVCAP